MLPQPPPTWSGEYVDVDLKNKWLVLTTHPQINQPVPLIIQLHGSEDAWVTLFSTIDNAEKTIAHVKNKFGMTGSFNMIKMDDAEDLFNVVVREGIRVMLDPRWISDSHTKWHEPVQDGDVWKYAVDGSRN